MVGEAVEKLEGLYTASGNVKWYNWLGNLSGNLLKR